jgi:hypothetical protein
VLGFGAHLYLSGRGEVADFTQRERNRDEVQIVGVTAPVVAAKRAEETRRAVQNLAGSACVEFYGIAPADAQRAHDAFATLQLGPRLVERRIEEVTRYWVFLPPNRDRKLVEARMAELRRQGVLDLSIRPDNSISLGVFSTEDAARRFLASIEAKGVRGAEQGPFAKDLREVVMLVREPDTETVARLTILQRDYPGTQMRAVPCP